MSTPRHTPKYSNRAQGLIDVVSKFIYMPCAPSPLIYTELAFEALARIGWAYTSPDIREAITKISGRSSLCHVKGGLQATGLVEPPWQGKTRRVLWSVLEAADRATWYAFIIGATATAAYDFFSGAVKLAGCVDPPPSGNWGYGTRPFGGWPSTTNWYVGPTWRAPDWPTTPGTPISWDLDPGDHFAHTGSFQCASLGGLLMPFNIRYVDTVSGTVYKEESADFHFNDGSHWSGFYPHKNNTGSFQRIEFQVQFPLAPPLGPAITVFPFGSGYSWWS